MIALLIASAVAARWARITPNRHHFELAGWPETTVIVRFWLVSGAFVAVAVAIFVADFTHQVAPP